MCRGLWNAVMLLLTLSACTSGESSAAPPSPQRCGTLAHGEHETRSCFASPSVPYGGECTAVEQSRTCDNGTLSAWPACEHLACSTAPASPENCAAVELIFCPSDLSCQHTCDVCAGLPDLQGDTCAHLRPFKMGVVPIPQAFTQEGIIAAYDLSARAGEVVSLSHKLAWTSTANVDAYAPDVALARARGLDIIISIDPLTDDRSAIANLPPGWESKDFSDSVLRQAFIDEVVSIADTYRPAYLSLGMEINGYARAHDLTAYASLYAGTYAAVKAAVPDLPIGVTWNYESLVMEGQWALLAQIAPAEAYFFTTYPGFIYATPDSVDPGYYTALNGLGAADLWFLEIGWTGGDGDEAEQAQFVDTFFARTEALAAMHGAIWCLLHDWQGGGAFETMGLISGAGEPRPSWERWLAHVARPRP